MSEHPIDNKPENPYIERDLEIMTPAKYRRLSEVKKRDVIERHLALIADHDILQHVALFHPTAAGYGPPGNEERLHRSLHERDINALPSVVVKGKEVVVAYAPPAEVL